MFSRRDREGLPSFKDCGWWESSFTFCLPFPVCGGADLEEWVNDRQTLRQRDKATSNHFDLLFMASIRFPLNYWIWSLAASGRNFDASMVKSLWSVMVLEC